MYKNFILKVPFSDQSLHPSEINCFFPFSSPYLAHTSFTVILGIGYAETESSS